jgi:hypothetical protein
MAKANRSKGVQERRERVKCSEEKRNEGSWQAVVMVTEVI